MPQKRRKMHSGDTHLRRGWRVRSRKRDMDEVCSLFSYTLLIHNPQINLFTFYLPDR